MLQVETPAAEEKSTPSHTKNAQWRKTFEAGAPVNSLLSGAIAGAIEASTTYPFEWAKTSLQLPQNSTIARSPLELFRHTITTEGVSSIYKGCESLIAGTALKASVRFFTFDSIRAQLVDSNGKLSAGNGILAGMAAGAAESVLAVTPTERIKTAMIDDAKGAKRFRSAPHAVRLLIAEQGFQGLYKGLVSTTLKQSATSAVRMGSYNVLKSEYQRRFQGSPGAIGTFMMGAVAGTITVYATQPLDTIKTRAQGAKGESMAAAVRNVIAEYGPAGFWKGSTMRLGRLMLSGGIVFSVYENVSAGLHMMSRMGEL